MCVSKQEMDSAVYSIWQVYNLKVRDLNLHSNISHQMLKRPDNQYPH